MKSRLCALMGRSKCAGHGRDFSRDLYGILKWAYRISGQNILSEEEKYQILRSVISSRDADAQDEEDFLHDLAEEIGRVKNGRIPVEKYVSGKCDPERFRQITGNMKKSGNPPEARF